jgi:hypothetical protein
VGSAAPLLAPPARAADSLAGGRRGSREEEGRPAQLAGRGPGAGGRGPGAAAGGTGTRRSEEERKRDKTARGPSRRARQPGSGSGPKHGGGRHVTSTGQLGAVS